MTKEQINDIDRLMSILEESISVRKDFEQTSAELKKVRKLLEHSNAINDEEHQSFRESFLDIRKLLTEINFDDQRKREQCLRTTQKIYDEINRVDEKKTLNEIAKEIWQIILKERKHIAFWSIVLTTIIAIWHGIEKLLQIIENLTR